MALSFQKKNVSSRRDRGKHVQHWGYGRLGHGFAHYFLQSQESLVTCN